MSFFYEPQMIIDVNRINEKFNYTTIIETGTHTGQSTIYLADRFEKVYTCELYDEYFSQYDSLFANYSNIKVLKGSSIECLPKFFDEIGNDKFILYLDAHWIEDCPIYEELEIVAKYGYKPIILIHDFDCGFPKPEKDENGHPTTEGWQFNEFIINGVYHKLDYKHMKPYMDKIYGENGYYFETSKEAKTESRGDLRGCGFFYPKI